MAEEAFVQIAEQDGKSFLLLRGTVDVSVADQFRLAALRLAERSEDATVGCEQLERLDTSAIQILLGLKEDLKKNGKHLVLQGVPLAVSNQLQLAGLAQILLQEENKI